MSNENESQSPGTSASPEETADPAPPSCQGCQPAREAGANFCPHCGHDLSAKEPPVGTQLRSPAEEVSQVSALGLSEARMPVQEDDTEVCEPASPTPVEMKESAALQQQGPDQKRPARPGCCQSCGSPLPSATYRLVGKGPDNADLCVELTDTDLTIGKGQDCDVRIDRDEYVSRKHARVYHSDEMIFLEDMGSSNGTFLRVRRPIILEPGDEILVGASVLQLEQGQN